MLLRLAEPTLNGVTVRRIVVLDTNIDGPVNGTSMAVPPVAVDDLTHLHLVVGLGDVHNVMLVVHDVLLDLQLGKRQRMTPAGQHHFATEFGIFSHHSNRQVGINLGEPSSHFAKDLKTI